MKAWAAESIGLTLVTCPATMPLVGTGESELSKFLGEAVVIDTDTPLVYMGKVSAVDQTFVVLEDVDVHDINDTPTTKELYIMEARKHGVKKNRRSAHLRTERIVSISKLEDVIDY